MNTTGIFAEPVGAAANYVMIFIIFGNFLQETAAATTSSSFPTAWWGRPGPAPRSPPWWPPDYSA
jgi:TRAP-type uncharacterized transport system fused permease subunit